MSSNLRDLPAGTRIYYDLNAGPTAGAVGFFDQNIFVYVSDSQWAVGRCTAPDDINKPNKTGLCTLSDGVGPLAGFSARIVVTHQPDRSNNIFSPGMGPIGSSRCQKDGR